MIQVLQKAAYKHGYLFIIAAWLYTISFIFTNYWSYSSTPDKVQTTLENYVSAKEKRFDDIIKNRALLNVILNDSVSDAKRDLTDESFGLFAYQLNDLGNPLQLFWNTNKIAIDENDISRPDGNYAVKYQNGLFEFIKRTVPYKQKQYFLVGLIPLRWDYFIENKYLKSAFEGFPEIENDYKLSYSDDALPIKNSKGKVLFKLEKKPGASLDHPDAYSVFLRVLTIIFFFLFINALALEIVAERGFLFGFFFLTTIVVNLRMFSYFFPFPFDFRKLEIFDPTIYASNALHPSLGDLLINSVILYWMVLFIKFSKPELWKRSYNLPAKVANLVTCVSLFAFAFVSIEIATIVRSLIVDSKISFDATNFFGLTIYTITGFAILCFLVVSYYHLSHLFLLPASKTNFGLYWRIVIVVASGLFLLSFTVEESTTAFKIAALGWLVIYLLLLKFRERDLHLPIIQSPFFVFWAIFFSASLSVLLVTQIKSYEVEVRKRIAEKLASQTDPSGESLISLAISNFSDQFLVSNFSRFKSDSALFVKDSLIATNFSGYLNKFDTRIYTYNNKYQSLHNEDATSYYAIEALFQNVNNQGKSTGIPNLYYFENNINRFSYLFKKEIKSTDSTTMGYFYVTMRPKRYKSDALFPELFKQVKDIESDLSTNYAFAVYNKLHLINSFNTYPFPDSLYPSKLPTYDFEQHDNKDYNELWYKASGNKLIIIARKDTFLTDWLTLFAYIFCSFIGFVLIFYFANFILKARFNLRNLKELFRVSIRMQIQTTIIFISVFSFIVIGVATISFFISRFNTSNEDKLSKSIQVIANEIELSLQGLLEFTDILSLNDFGYVRDFDRKILEISNIHNADVNVYDANGNLLVSTQPYIYTKQILSKKMQPKAYYRLRYNHQVQYIQDERIGNFSFLSIYAPLKSENGETIAYLNIPYLNSQSELNQEISSFVITLINLNALIFVLSGAIALLVTNRITSSFELIGNKMKKINLGEKNEEITWDRDDEIGTLVNEYNKMVMKLEESAEALARSEREGAWQEMARQVAHEIKNPLTPMKLSIQYLQKALNNEASNVRQLSKQVAATLVEQIDQLSKIAGDFAQFANIGNVTPERFDITEVLDSLIHLYLSDSNLIINWQKHEGTFEIISDKTQVNRLFTNLIKNAIEASPEDEEIEICINQYIESGNVIVSITDKGHGIPSDMQHKIFVPNFTTKSSGTGLGLAICKGIVEKANGKIWFKTKQGTGSTFYVSFPLAED